MMLKLLRRPATVLLAALLISIGCTRSGDNGDRTNGDQASAVPPVANQPAANQPADATTKVDPPEKEASERPPKTLPPQTLPPQTLPPQTLPPKTLPPKTLPLGKAPLVGAAEPKLKPLELAMPAIPPKPLDADTVPRANPLRNSPQPPVMKNPMRDGVIRGDTPKQPRPLPPPPISKATKKPASTFDPVKVNGPIFVGWPQPKLAIVITGREDGYIEPCGCAGLDRMKGGLSRRHTMIENLRKRGWPLLCVDVGGLSKGYGVQAELKFQVTVDGMKKMGYKAIGFSPNDLRLPVDSLVAVAAGSEDNPSPFVSADVGLLGFDAKITARWRVVDVGGVKVGITSVLGKQFARGLAGDDIEIEDPQAALARVVPELKKRCKLMVLLAYATVENSIALSKQYPEFAVVVTAGGPPSPPAVPMVIKETKSLLIEVGEKGMDAIVLGLYADENQPYRYQRVPLDSRFASSKDMRNLMVAYQDRLRTLGLAGLAIRPVTHPSRAVNGEFVGSKACESCHEAAYDIWKHSGHAKAWTTLLRTDPPRDADPECISCHVVGWHPSKHFPYKSGFLGEQLTPKMLGVGCESCHGPGGQHVKAEMGSDATFQLRLQKAMRITKEEAKNHAEKACRNCHDLDNSPDFKFDAYCPKVEHKGSD